MGSPGGSRAAGHGGKTLVFAVAGGIASGKSTVAGHLEELGGVVIDADRIGHELLDGDAEVRTEIERAFGPGVFRPDGRVDRRELGSLVFSQDRLRERLDRIVHPRIASEMWRRVGEHRRRGTPLVVIDAALFLDLAPPESVDLVIVTTASREERLRRLRERNGLEREEAVNRLLGQPRAGAWREQADLVLDTSDPPARVRERLLREILARFSGLRSPSAPS
jgi:dephospho-CoA kinase